MQKKSSNSWREMTLNCPLYKQLSKVEIQLRGNSNSCLETGHFKKGILKSYFTEF